MMRRVPALQGWHAPLKTLVRIHLTHPRSAADLVHRNRAADLLKGRVGTLTTTPQPSRIASAFRALRHRNFQVFFGGQLISLIGTWMQNVAQSWLVYKLTGAPLQLGPAGFSPRIPLFLLSPVGGA